jgi:hypothetical protein
VFSRLLQILPSPYPSLHSHADAADKKKQAFRSQNQKQQSSMPLSFNFCMTYQKKLAL